MEKDKTDTNVSTGLHAAKALAEDGVATVDATTPNVANHLSVVTISKSLQFRQYLEYFDAHDTFVT